MPITTKWPRLTVVGQPVTEDQADEILIRTGGWYHFSTNDRTWRQQIDLTAHLATGWPIEPPQQLELEGEERAAVWRTYHEARNAWRERMGILNLHYLENARIASCWVGGPHGWCNWDGRIGCDNYNLGKWPSDEAITEDWRAIAAAFPFLDLTAQCVDDEGEGQLAAQWRVTAGTVVYDPEPTELIGDGMWEEPSILTVLTVGGERGCAIERLRQALERVAAKAGESA